MVITSSHEYRSRMVKIVCSTYLHRAPSGIELSSWVTRPGTGHTMERLRSVVLGSGEYLQSHGGTNDSLVVSVYHDVLGRAPDAASRAA